MCAAATWAPSAIAIVIAVVVPWLTFRLALRQDRARWLREQRTQLYADLLTEAYAKRQYFEYAVADEETRERMREYFVDLRLPPADTARLVARSAILASPTVNKLFEQFLVESLPYPRDDDERTIDQVRMETRLDELEAAVRRELGAGVDSVDGH